MMKQHNLDFSELEALLRSLLQPTTLVELGLMLACLGLSWLIVSRLRRLVPEHGHHSVLLGRHVVDGVLFPVLALLLAVGARRAMPLFGQPVALFKLIVPVLMSLVVIRLVARVMRAALPNSAGVKLLERSVSWLAWGDPFSGLPACCLSSWMSWTTSSCP